MKSKSIITHITPVEKNIFEDLGFPPSEAGKLLEEVDLGIHEGNKPGRTFDEPVVPGIASEIQK